MFIVSVSVTSDEPKQRIMSNMHYYEIAPTILIRTDANFFTYSSTEQLLVGLVVIIPVGKKTVTGVVLRKTTKPSYDTKSVIETIEQTPLPSQMIELANWLSSYYHSHLAATLQTVLPRGVTKQRRARTTIPRVSPRNRTNFVLNIDQQAAVDTISSMQPGTALLHGVTGSGKTAVYIESAKEILALGRSVIILVPEIALTSQLVAEFSHHFNDIILTHSKQTEAERHLAWKEALTSKEPRVAIGPRSALFLPLAYVGLVVIDEAHEPSYKQEQSPRYSALRAASILMKHHDGKLILGSATPSISDYYLAEHASRPIITLPVPARTTTKPTITLIDMTKRANFSRHRFFSTSLLKNLDETLESGNQALIFHNRRGSASTTLCENCGWQAGCPRCFLPLTLHADKHHLRCHVCGHTDAVPTSCPSCHHADVIHKGIGTKLIESELLKLYPNKVIKRFDGDSDTADSVEQQYESLYDGSIDIIIGTQVIAKGLDLPKLRTVGVIQADSGLSLPDFGASERTFQLLAQAIGRVGRSEHKTTVVVQSYQPTHPAVVDGLSQNYEQFYTSTLDTRKRTQFPPFVYLLKLTCQYKTEQAAIRNAQSLVTLLRKSADPSIQILGPTPAFYERQRDTYRWQMVLKSSERHLLVSALDLVPPTHWQTELDPMSLL